MMEQRLKGAANKRAEKNLQNDVMSERPPFVAEKQQEPPSQKGLDFDRLTPEEQRRVLDG
jgi:hypothetical protein